MVAKRKSGTETPAIFSQRPLKKKTILFEAAVVIPHFAVCYSLNKRRGSAGALLKANSENYTLS